MIELSFTEKTQPALIGRRAEVALLGRKLDGVENRQGAVVLVAGEDGIGKTRLVAEVERQAGERGMLFLRGEGEGRQAELAYGIFVGVLRGLAQHSTPREGQFLRALVGETAPHLREALVEVLSRNGHIAEGNLELRQRLFLARLTSLLLERAQRQPLVICLEDLHWADSASLQLLLYLASRNASCPLLVLGTFCPERARRRRVAGDVEGVLLGLYRNTHVQVQELARLSAVETRELVGVRLGRAELSEELHERLYRQTAGVPLVVVQYLEYLRARGLVYQRGAVLTSVSSRDPAGIRSRLNTDLSSWPATGQQLTEETPIPARAVLAQRLADLTPEQQRLLAFAALQGEYFEGVLTAASLGWPRLRVLRELGRLELGAGMVASVEQGFRFCHPLLAEVCYQSLPEAERCAGHLRLAHLLEQREPREVERLAFHFSAAGALRRALPYLLEAGMRARTAFANQEAKQFLERALAVVEPQEMPGDGPRKVEILLALAELQEYLGEWDLAGARCLEVLRSPAADRRAVARAQFLLGGLHGQKCEWEAGEEAYRRALGGFEALGDEPAQVAVYARLGGLALEQARLDEGSESLGQARLLARQGGDKAALGVVSFGLGVVGQQRGQYLAAVLHYTEALQAFRQADHRYGICQVYHRFGELHAAQQRWPEALKCYAESARLARQMGAVSLLAHILAGTALAQLGAGDGAAASASCAAARMYMEQMGDRRGLAECDKVEGVIHRQQAQYAPAEELLERGRKLYLVLGIRLGVAECERELGLLLQGCGDVEGARQRLQESSALFGRIGAREEARRAEELLAALAA